MAPSSPAGNAPSESDPPESDPPESDPPESDPPESDPPESDPPESARATKLLTVNYRNGERVGDHPALSAWIEGGWTVKSAAPRLAAAGLKLLVVLTRTPVRRTEAPAPGGVSPRDAASQSSPRAPIRRESQQPGRPREASHLSQKP